MAGHCGGIAGRDRCCFGRFPNAKFHTCGGPRRRPASAKARQGRRILDEDVIKECGRELYEKGGTREMTRCCDLLDLTVHRNYQQGDNKNNYNVMVIEPLARLVEFYWVDIGEWQA